MNIQNIVSLDEQYYMNTFGPRTPVAFERGQGCELYDTQGKTYLDFVAGIATVSLGHSHPGVAQAVAAQVQTLTHTSNLYYIKNQALLAEQLIKAVGAPSGLSRVFIANSGAEANEGMLKLARAYHYKRGAEKYEIISANNSFHGRTLATVAATGQPKYQAPYRPLTPGFINVAYNDIEAIRAALTDKTAAVLLETIQGEGGVIEGDAAYLKAVEALCRDRGILLLLDEVQTGMGRTGAMLSCEHFGLKPDIITLAKALGNGVPIGAVLAKEEVAQAFAPGDHGSTFGGNPLACAAGLAVLTAMTEPGFLDAVKTTGDYFKAKLSALGAKYPAIITQVRGRGLILGAQLSDSIDGKKIVSALLDRGLLINCAAHNTLRFIPPLIVTPAQIDRLVMELDDVLTKEAAS